VIGQAIFHAFSASIPRNGAAGNCPPKVVQQLLGHGSMVMTLDRYGHLFPRGDDRNELSKAVSVLLA